MATSGSDSRDAGNGEQPPARRLPSYEDYRRIQHGVGLTDHAKRIFWTLNGPLATAISVMEKTYYEPDSVLEPYSRQTPTEGQSWHPVSRGSFFTPPVSSITLHVDPLEGWEDWWYEYHYRHPEPLSDWIGSENEDVRVGPLPDYDPEHDEDLEYDEEEGPPAEPVFLLKCCGVERPRNKKIKVVIEAEGSFLTVHDIISTLHPRLLDAREDILGALGALSNDFEPLPTETKLMVWGGCGDVMVEQEDEWISAHREPREDWAGQFAGSTGPCWWQLHKNEAGEWAIPPGTFPPDIQFSPGIQFPPGTPFPPGIQFPPEILPPPGTAGVLDAAALKLRRVYPGDYCGDGSED